MEALEACTLGKDLAHDMFKKFIQITVIVRYYKTLPHNLKLQSGRLFTRWAYLHQLEAYWAQLPETTYHFVILTLREVERCGWVVWW